MPGVANTMGEYKRGELHSGSKTGPKVTSREQAIAIALSEQRAASKGHHQASATKPAQNPGHHQSGATKK